MSYVPNIVLIVKLSVVILIIVSVSVVYAEYQVHECYAEFHVLECYAEFHVLILSTMILRRWVTQRCSVGIVLDL